MYCNQCGTQNREGASFCKVCGQRLQSVPAPPPSVPPTGPGPEPNPPQQPGTWGAPPPHYTPPAVAQPPPAPAALSSPQSKRAMGGGLVTFGALLVLFGFMTTWASCGAAEFSGYDLATSATSSYGGSQDATVSFLWLVLLAGLGLLILGGLNAAHSLGLISTSPVPAQVTRALDLAAVVGGLGIAGLFFIRVLAANAEAGFQMIKLGGGYWLSVFGFLLAAAGVALTSVADRPRAGP
jgi:hypothetical protein